MEKKLEIHEKMVDTKNAMKQLDKMKEKSLVQLNAQINDGPQRLGQAKDIHIGAHGMTDEDPKDKHM